jgi:hypothetical protein
MNSDFTDQSALLRAYGYTDDQIATMSLAQRQAEIADAKQSGLGKQDNPASERNAPAVGNRAVRALSAALSYIPGILGLILLLLCVASQDEGPPDHAKVIADYKSDRFTTWRCLKTGSTEIDPITLFNSDGSFKETAFEERLSSARSAGFRKDRKCDDAGGFNNERKIIWRLLGLFDRWTPEGDWRR